jgi:hypothetical protein
MVASLLDRVIYSYADVDRLVGLRSGTAKRWLEGYSRTSRFYEPVLRDEPTGSDSVTWGEMVEARMLAEFRSRDVPVQRLRPAIRNVRAEALAEDYRAGTSRDELSDLYDLTTDQVDAALRFEIIAGSERAS